jgi:MFS family permease
MYMADIAHDDAVSAEQRPVGRNGMFAPLRHRDFALLWSGQAFSAIGNTMFPIILAILVLDRGAGAAGLGLILAVQGLALAAGTALAASLGDRWRRSRVMICTDMVRAVGVMAIALSPLHLPSAALIALVLAIGVAEGMFLPAYGAVVPRVLPEAQLQAGNALTALSQYVALVIGPVLAGVLVAAIGAGPALWVDVATFGASLATLILINEVITAPVTERPRQGALRRGRQDLVEGLRAVWERPWVAAAIGAATVIMTLAVAPAFLAAPIVSKQRLGGAAAYGAMFAALGVGSVIGSILGGRIRSRHPGTVAYLGVFAIVGSVGSLAFLPLPGILVFWAIAGIGVSIFQILWMTAIQREIPDQLLGRVMALDWLGSQGLMPFGYALAGVIVSAVGVRDMLIGGAILVLVVVPLPLFVRGSTTFSSAPQAQARPVESTV